MLMSADVNKIAAIIQQGGVVAYPTEAVFGLGCDPHNQAAVQRLLALKQRSIEKGLIVIAADLAQLSDYMGESPSEIETARLNTKLSCPPDHPTTWLIPANPRVPKWITGQYRRVAVRISTHRACQQLCLAVAYPIVSTSANPSGYEPARDIETVRAYFESQQKGSEDSNGIDAIFSAPLGHYQRASIIRDAVTDQIIR